MKKKLICIMFAFLIASCSTQNSNTPGPAMKFLYMPVVPTNITAAFVFEAERVEFCTNSANSETGVLGSVYIRKLTPGEYTFKVSCFVGGNLVIEKSVTTQFVADFSIAATVSSEAEFDSIKVDKSNCGSQSEGFSQIGFSFLDENSVSFDSTSGSTKVNVFFPGDPKNSKRWSDLESTSINDLAWNITAKSKGIEEITRVQLCGGKLNFFRVIYYGEIYKKEYKWPPQNQSA